MQYFNKAESFIGIITWIFILSFVLLGIWNLIFYSRSTTIQYQDYQRLSVLKENIGNILMEVDTNWVQQNEIFYIYKDEVNKTFSVFTGTTHSDYKYINYLWKKIDINSYNGDIYARTLWKQRDDRSLESDNEIIRVSIKKLIKK